MSYSAKLSVNNECDVEPIPFSKHTINILTPRYELYKKKAHFWMKLLYVRLVCILDIHSSVLFSP